ncbi:glucans biosynthesis glucosyltransferase MdoH [Parahaliea aestuarii]|uniref:Glucans biosynthesis glucosyltransferase H n=1 Tax=Parahaliea aestuarii TaxID=1852021 RepID=A0A5C8ZWI0_9GAMM|nr:glucans biosynthesis glucosyltransferase MdoH [Parahaliea aestuarii]TXS91601.1 glucans biosynthesis glucosyltransferase MdoH [Parahaliea aestuarii]
MTAEPRLEGPALPPEAPLEMPRHCVHERASPQRTRPGPWQALKTALSRLLVAAVTLLLAHYGISEMYAVLSTTSITVLQWGFLLIFGINFSWIAFAFAQALLGFLSSLLPRLQRPPEHTGELPFRTAILLPVYNEAPRRIAAAIQVMRDGLAAQAPGHYAFFILSDSNRADAWLDEEQVFSAMCRGSQPDCPVYYRHRADNAERKAGNIADWVKRWGAAYEAMIVLDADSVMSPASLITLTRRLAADPGLGLIQTLPCIVRARSLYGRLQQFANQCYGPVYARGLAAWHGRASNFWGHNAIIRTRAFAGAAGLPLLSGKPPFGGHVLSHDFIEAALLRRAGWGVRFDCDIGASFEEAPPSLVDVLVRDRRWCQGNLQHSRFLLARGLSGASRLHLLTGILSYLSAVFWLGLVLLGLAIALQASLVRPEYFAQPALFPTWPVFDAERARWLFGISMAVILAPKWFGGVLALLQPRRLMGFGGPLLLPLSLLTETLLSALYAPILMLGQSRVVWSVLRGKDAGWQPQSRDDGALSVGTALRTHWGHTLFGATLAATAWFIHPELFLWLLPITAGLLLSVPLSWLSGGAARGRLFDALGLLRAPGERRKPTILTRLQSAEQEPAFAAQESYAGALVRLQDDADLYRWHLAQLPVQAPEATRQAFHAPSVTAAWKVERDADVTALENCLDNRELLALLADRALMERTFGEIPEVPGERRA